MNPSDQTPAPVPEPAPRPALDPAFLRVPIAHRGLHGPGVPENSLAAVRAAVAAGYGIELDIQHNAEGDPVVFHDYDLERLIGIEGFIADTPREELAKLRLKKTDEAVPTLTEVLREVAGRVPLLLEIKDQDGRLGDNVGDLQDRVAAALGSYEGPVAVMSFNPETIAAFTRTAPELVAGLVTCAFDEDDWPMLDDKARERLGRIEDVGRAGASFVSHDWADLANPAVVALHAQGMPVLTWTIRSPEAEAAARAAGADNVTFEDYLPDGRS